MGCGCGKKKVQRAAPRATVPTPASSTKTAVAQTYQSGTMRKAPTGPVTRKTV